MPMVFICNADMHKLYKVIITRVTRPCVFMKPHSHFALRTRTHTHTHTHTRIKAAVHAWAEIVSSSGECVWMGFSQPRNRWLFGIFPLFGWKRPRLFWSVLICEARGGILFQQSFTLCFAQIMNEHDEKWRK